MDILDNEIWVPVRTFDEDYSDDYMVSNLGRCWSIKSQKFVGSWHKGYYYVGLCKDGKQGSKMIGRIMLISFGIPIPEHLKGLDDKQIECSHIDEDSTNNRLENLCWESHRENCGRSLRRKRCSKISKGRHMSEETKQKIKKTYRRKLRAKMRKKAEEYLKSLHNKS